MSESTKIISIVFAAFNLMLLAMVYFPHFMMHFLSEGPMAGMGFNSPYFTGRCKHDDEEINLFSRKAARRLKFVFPICVVLVILFVIVDLNG